MAGVTIAIAATLSIDMIHAATFTAAPDVPAPHGATVMAATEATTDAVQAEEMDAEMAGVVAEMTAEGGVADR